MKSFSTLFTTLTLVPAQTPSKLFSVFLNLTKKTWGVFLNLVKYWKELPLFSLLRGVKRKHKVFFIQHEHIVFLLKLQTFGIRGQFCLFPTWPENLNINNLWDCLKFKDPLKKPFYDLISSFLFQIHETVKVKMYVRLVLIAMTHIGIKRTNV